MHPPVCPQLCATHSQARSSFTPFLCQYKNMRWATWNARFSNIVSNAFSSSSSFFFFFFGSPHQRQHILLPIWKWKLIFNYFYESICGYERNVNLRVRAGSTNVHINFLVSNLISRSFHSTFLFTIFTWFGWLDSSTSWQLSLLLLNLIFCKSQHQVIKSYPFLPARIANFLWV